MNRWIGNQQNPEWLESLGGDSPLLNSSQYEFVSDVRNMIRRGMAAEAEPSPRTRRAVSRDLSRFRLDFVEVVEHLQRSSSDRLQFLNTYLGWRVSRQRTIRELNKVADSIDEHKQNCEAVKIIGSGVSCLGGGLCLASGSKEARGRRTNEPNLGQMIGSIMMGIGSIAAAGTSVVGTILLHENIEAAKKTVAADKRNLMELWSWVTDTTDALSSLNNIQHMEVDRSFRDVADRLLAVFNRNRGENNMQVAVQSILRTLNCPPDLRNGIADVVGILVSTNMLCDRYRPLRDLTITGSGCMERLRGAMDLFQSAGSLDTALSVHRRAGLTPAQRDRVVNCMIQDITNIGLTALEMDSESIESREIRRAAQNLEIEADTFEELYDSMMKISAFERQNYDFY